MGLRTAITLALAIATLTAPARAEERPAIQAVWAEVAPVIDGKLDDAVWGSAAAAGEFVERKPVLRARPADATVVRIVFDAEALYVGVRCEDSEPEEIRANVRTRDTLAMFADDAISVKLDVKSDQRTTLGFVLNPAGAMVDYRGVNEGAFHAEFDAIWQGAASRDEGGWSAEFRLPWTALELDPGDAPARVGINLTRDHPRRNATYDWALMPPPFSPVSASLYGDLLGLDDLSRRLVASGEAPGVLKAWHVAAYGLGGFRHVPVDDDATEATVYEPIYNGGLDGRLDFGRLQLDLTTNTDFAQVDLDNQVVNLGRFGLFLPEKRDFFLSSMELFEFGFGGLFQLLHTRRIGLHDGEEVPIAEGLKVTTRPVDDLQMSLLHVTTTGTDELPATSHGVLRGQYELGGGSNVGLMVTHRQSFADVDDHNLTVGLDGAWRGSGSPMLVESFAAVSLQSAPATSEEAATDGVGAMVGTFATWRGEVVRPHLAYLYVHPDFQADLGFIQRTGVQALVTGLTLEARPTALGFEKMELFTEGMLVTDEAMDELLDWNVQSAIRLYGASGYGGKLEPHFGSELVTEDFDVGGKTITAGRYEGLKLHTAFWTPHNNPLSVVAYVDLGDYYDGHILTAGAHLNLRPVEALRVDGSIRVDHTTFEDGTGFDAIVINGSANVDFSTDLGLKVQVGWNRLEDRFLLQSRLRWAYLPGSDLFLVYQLDLDTTTTAPAFQSLQLKATFRYPWG